MVGVHSHMHAAAEPAEGPESQFFLAELPGISRNECLPPRSIGAILPSGIISTLPTLYPSIFAQPAPSQQAGAKSQDGMSQFGNADSPEKVNEIDREGMSRTATICDDFLQHDSAPVISCSSMLSGMQRAIQPLWFFCLETSRCRTCCCPSGPSAPLLVGSLGVLLPIRRSA